MSRFKGVPGGYDPGLVLQLRARDEGGGILPAVRADPSSPPSASRELVVLVHGFNNHLGEAVEAYVGFRGSQSALCAPPLNCSQLESSLADVFWPGDADWPGMLDIFDFLVYPAAVGIARDAAQRLAAHLSNELPCVLKLHFVGHSLGCRIVLETIRIMRDRGRCPAIGHVVLMAAAVPVGMMEVGGQLHAASAAAEHVLVLHSTADWVLHVAFPFGQTLAGEGILPMPLGRCGKSPHMSGNMEATEISGAGHGDYWGRVSDDPNRRAAVAVARELKLGAMDRIPAGVPRGVGGGATSLGRRSFADARDATGKRGIGLAERRFGRA